MKVNTLFTIEDMAMRRASAGKADPDLHVRATGRSTGMALEAIGYAMQQTNQGRVLDVRIDHYQKLEGCNAPRGPSYSEPEREAQRRQMTLMQALVEQLGLKGFRFNKADLTYIYNVIYEV